MMSHLDKIKLHALAQQRAATVLDTAASFITAGVTEREIVAKCTQLLQDNHLSETWYYHVPVLAYVGKRTTVSMSGREYQPTALAVKEDDVVTIALSPKIENCWAAIARTFIVQGNKVVTMPATDSSHYDICKFQAELHRMLVKMARPDLRFEELYTHFNALIESAGYINLDYHGNLGHSLENDLSKRRFIEKNNRTLLSECDLFALETHIGKVNMNYGFKHENIYYFDNDKLVMLPMELLI